MAGSILAARRYNDVTFEAMNNNVWAILWDWIEAHVSRPSHPLGPASSINDNKILEQNHIMAAVLLDMTDASGPGTFPQEKIAILRSGSLMFVPMNARP